MMATTGAQTGAALHPDLEKIASRQNGPPAYSSSEALANEADAELLGK
jgi:hypothetical protein